MNQSYTISIIGSGLVGSSTGIGFGRMGNDVIFYDIDRKKLETLRKKGYRVTSDVTEAIDTSQISFLCVQTPTTNGRIDLTYVKEAAISVAKALQNRKSYHLVVIRSTTIPFTTQSGLLPLLKQCSQLTPGKDFGVCMNPEFLREASALEDFMNPCRTVIGQFDKQSGDMLEELYLPFKAPLFRTDLTTAEMIKYVSNLFLACKISFFNEIHTICEEVGLNSKLVAEIVSLDPRIGDYGIYGGRPFEGGCLPKDLEAFIGFVESRNLNPKLLHAIRYINKKYECSKEDLSNVVVSR